MGRYTLAYMLSDSIGAVLEGEGGGGEGGRRRGGCERKVKVLLHFTSCFVLPRLLLGDQVNITKI